MAVELTQVALWIETVDPGLPLGFFDAQVRCGDALLGVYELAVLEQGVPDAAYKSVDGRRQDRCETLPQGKPRGQKPDKASWTSAAHRRHKLWANH